MAEISNKVVDLQAILDALLPLMRERPCSKEREQYEGYVTIELSTEEFKAAANVIAGLQLADLVNYKLAQASFPRLLQALKLILSIADNPEANPTEKISLSSKTRAQLDSALRFAEKS